MKELTVCRNESGEWLITCREMPGFVARGKTQQEALEKMKQAFAIYFPCGDDNCREGK